MVSNNACGVCLLQKSILLSKYVLYSTTGKIVSRHPMVEGEKGPDLGITLETLSFPFTIVSW